MTRKAPEIVADLADLERHLIDMPPHHAGGTRRAAEERLEDLRRELARSRALEADGWDA